MMNTAIRIQQLLRSAQAEGRDVSDSELANLKAESDSLQAAWMRRDQQ